jgi:c-di-GMP-binding flagellar brake protein YcgR
VFDFETETGFLHLRLTQEISEHISNNARGALLEFTKSDALYQLPVDVAESFMRKDPSSTQPSHFLSVRLQASGRRIQRRNHFRLPIKISVRFKTVKLPEGYEKSREVRKHAHATWSSTDQPFKLGNTFDLSGGGVALASPILLARDDFLFMEFSIENQSFQMTGRVGISRANKKDDEMSCIVGVEFFSIDPRDQDDIVQFIFREQNKKKQELL